MSIMQALCSPGKEILLVSVMLLLLLQAFILLALRRLKRRGGFSLLAWIQFALLFVMFFLMLDGIFHYGDPAKPRSWPAFTTAFCSLPLAGLVLFEDIHKESSGQHDRAPETVACILITYLKCKQKDK